MITSRSATANISAWARTSRGWSFKVVIEAINRRMPDLELAGPVERLRSNFVAGIKHMPVRFTPMRVSAGASAPSQSAGVEHAPIWRIKNRPNPYPFPAREGELCREAIATIELAELTKHAPPKGKFGCEGRATGGDRN